MTALPFEHLLFCEANASVIAVIKVSLIVNANGSSHSLTTTVAGTLLENATSTATISICL
ncbi:hypothetical protein [Candidatus Galacturonibacter soehngenii]|uniref:hypothetical protein n=1 Tax=Candidatus Galacturonatibacter soehngenii TaxID=2307010 RepID=UPI001FA98D93|nr:hypothetical protein [Candidatus Galacturonibacter soehngenii]